MEFEKTFNTPTYALLVEELSARLDEVSATDNQHEYKTKVYLRYNIRFESQISFATKVILINNGVNARLILRINPSVFFVVPLIMFALISAVYYCVNPTYWAFIFGFIVGIIVYAMLYVQLKLALENYMRTLVGRKAKKRNNF